MTLPRPIDSGLLPQLAMPMGGIGAGSISLNAFGGLQDFAIRNSPNMSAVPDGHGTTDSAFALLRVLGAGAGKKAARKDSAASGVTRLVEGPLPAERIYNMGLYSQGLRKSGHEGLPRFASARFAGAYPFGTVELRDPQVPLRVSVTGWNPFIPLDDVSSGIPCALMEYRLENPGRSVVSCELSFHLSHLMPGSGNGQAKSRAAAIPGMGVAFSNVDDPAVDTFGSAALAVVGHEPAIKGMWLRGGWFDAISALWRECSTGTFVENQGSTGNDPEGRNGGSLLVRLRIQPGKHVVVPFVVCWHAPNSNMRCDNAPPPAGCDPATGCCPAPAKPAWHPFYAGRWADAREAAMHVVANYASLRARSEAFRDALFSSTLPAPVIDAVSANLAIIKSPTILRQKNGNLWGWEGCFTSWGCCTGSCTHVWNYAQAIPHLFPALERTLREQELERSMDERGHVTFRSALPDGPPPHTYHAAADGQLGGIMKLFRDWRICGDLAWLARLYPLAKRSLDYGISTWDPDRRGLVIEPHHNTYDIEFWGPDGMCTSIYIGALSALADMAEALGKPAEAAPYRQLAAAGARAMEKELFNGEYFMHQVRHDDLKDRSFAEQVSKASGEVAALLRREGPKYQYGKGCLADGVIGAWMAELYGIATPLSRKHVRSTLAAIHRHNFKHDLSEHANCQRPGYALGAEAGLLLCTWPRGGKPTLPFPYSDEVWTGIEYQVASHCILAGLVDEGIEIVAAARGRYDGRVRNPFDEYECGSFYARAMASYALLPSLSGFAYSPIDGVLSLAPKLKPKGKAPFRCFFSTASGWGVVSLTRDALSVDVREGQLAISGVRLDGGDTVAWQATARPGARAVLALARPRRASGAAQSRARAAAKTKRLRH